MWSDGTFYSSVGGVSEEAVKRYIEANLATGDTPRGKVRTQKQRGGALTQKHNAK
ncbi:hypothetical protein I8751_16660 [Nostocaceae cyanobacterium CENA357]|uniref:Transposase n=1 Tax=Atlanticothrix silvestris CENA357 TaxID=1725252 RepID=A0A8J7L3E5_9CYAN|nr:hypothetical protein [Atlanticothrix silvestris]MBH8553974.1 hypothetical protein [Atlanticothrix silvestris CENA357]